MLGNAYPKLKEIRAQKPSTEGFCSALLFLPPSWPPSKWEGRLLSKKGRNIRNGKK